jgi:hypothetical protein
MTRAANYIYGGFQLECAEMEENFYKILFNICFCGGNSEILSFITIYPSKL